MSEHFRPLYHWHTLDCVGTNCKPAPAAAPRHRYDHDGEHQWWLCGCPAPAAEPVRPSAEDWKAMYDEEVVRNERLRERLVGIAPAAEPVPLTLEALTVETVVGWARFSSEDIRKALGNLRGPVDRDESLVMAAADLFASMMELQERWHPPTRENPDHD